MNMSVGQVNCDHGGVGFATDEHHLVDDIEGLAVRVLAAWCGNPFRHSETDGVDDGQVVAALHRDHHPIGGRVVNDVAHLTAQRNGGTDCASVGVDHRFGARTLVGRPHHAPSDVVGQSVGIGVGRGTEHDSTGILIDRGQLAVSGCGRIDTMLVRNHDHPMNVRQFRHCPHHGVRPHIKFDKFTGTHMRDE
jgi:hypothetical protein